MESHFISELRWNSQTVPSAITLELEWVRGSNTRVCDLVIGIEASFA